MSEPKTKRYLVVPGEGDPCPRCCQPTEIREHQEITAKHLRQPFYFARWFHCMNPACKVRMHCAERYKVWNPHLRGKKRDNLERWVAKRIEAKHAQRREQREVEDAVNRGQLVLWGDTWPDTGDVSTVDTSGAPPWE
jgi:hypothetical protein